MPMCVECDAHQGGYDLAVDAVCDALGDADGVIVAHQGSADDVVATMVAAGWTLSDRVEYVAGKRIRTLIPPSE